MPGPAGAGSERQLATWLREFLSTTLTGSAGELARECARTDFSLDQAPGDSLAVRDTFRDDLHLSLEQLARRNEQLLRLADGLTRLPEDQRTVLKLKFLQGLPLAEICQQTGHSRVAVAGLLFQGSKALRGLMNDPGGPGKLDPP